MIRDVSPCGRVLDVGCADRWPQAVLPEAEYWGLDTLGSATNEYKSWPDVFGTAQSLPFRSQTMNTVLLLDVLEHLERPEPALREIFRVLKSRGSLLVSVPFLYPIHDAPSDYRRWTVHGLRQLLSDAGFEDVMIKPTLGGLETSLLLFNLSITAAVARMTQEHRAALLMVPVCWPLIIASNLIARISSRLLPRDNDATAVFTAGYCVQARRP